MIRGHECCVERTHQIGERPNVAPQQEARGHSFFAPTGIASLDGASSNVWPPRDQGAYLLSLAAGQLSVLRVTSNNSALVGCVFVGWSYLKTCKLDASLDLSEMEQHLHFSHVGQVEALKVAVAGAFRKLDF
jgi:hypothetical protein